MSIFEIVFINYSEHKLSRITVPARSTEDARRIAKELAPQKTIYNIAVTGEVL